MKTFRQLLINAVCTLSFISCTKNTDTATDYITENTAHAEDQSRFSAEIDAVANDLDAALEITPAFSGRTGDLQSLICDATIFVDTLNNPRTLTINYNGNNCLGTRTRTGTIVISMTAGIKWRNAGASLNVSFQNLKVTRLSDNKSITINGTQVHTNVSGGLLINLPGSAGIVHTISSSNMSITFDNAVQRTWQVAKRRAFSYNAGVVITTTGMHTEGITTGIAEWGTNRFGHSFTSAVSDPLVVRQDCNFRVVSGKIKHWSTLANTTVTFGLDASGNATTCPGTGSYYLKLEWRGPSNIVRTYIIPY